MTRVLKSIGQHEGERGILSEFFVPNGVACPRCGKELRDVNPNVVLTTNPPRKSVVCRDCNWSGAITA